jgi:hypothetical protein
MLITQDNSSLHIQKRYGVFTTRKGFAEIGTVIEERIYFKSILEPREVVGGNNLILVKKDSRGELMTVEGETMLFEKTTFYIDVFNNLRMVCELLHGLIEMNLSNVTENFPISIKTEAIVVKTRKNAVFRMRNDRWNYTSGVLVKSGYVWVFDRINPDECVIINKNQSLILAEDERLYDAKMPDGIEIMTGCIEKFGEDEIDGDDDEDFSSEFSFDVKTYEHEGEDLPDDTQDNSSNNQNENNNNNSTNDNNNTNDDGDNSNIDIDNTNNNDDEDNDDNDNDNDEDNDD